MAAKYDSWLRQARRDLEHAERSLEHGYYEWACFAAQQSAEKAVKAVFLKANAAAWGHCVSVLLQQLPAPWEADPSLVDAARELDMHYIPPRYPDAYPEGAPYEYYTRQAAERAVGHTREVIAFCERLLAGYPGGEEPPAGGSEAIGGGAPRD